MEKITFMHPHVGKGRATLAIDYSDYNKVVVAIAFASPKDQFTRRKGRSVSLIRLKAATDRKTAKENSDEHLTFKMSFSLPDGEKLKNEVTQRFAEFLKTQDVPQWARNQGVVAFK